MNAKQLRARAKKFCGCPTYEAVGIREKCVVCQLVDNVDRLEREWERECADGDAVLRAMGLDPQEYRTEGGSLHLPKIRGRLSAQKRAIELMRQGEATLLGEANEALAACQSEGGGWKLLAGNLAVWVTRLARQLPVDKPSLRREAMEFLKAHSLVQPLRDDTASDKSEDADK